MLTGKTVFAQLMGLIPEYELKKCIDKYSGNFHALKYTCRDQFMIMSYAQFTDRSSLRDIEATLMAFSPRLYHSGLKFIPKSTLAEMNEKNNWLIYNDFAQVLIKWAKDLYHKDYFRLDLDEMVYAFDSSTIEVCLKLCPWAKFIMERELLKCIHFWAFVVLYLLSFGLVKLRFTTFNLLIFCLLNQKHIMDRGYVDFYRLFNYFQQRNAFFVTRIKNSLKYNVVEEHEVDKNVGLISDQSIKLTGLFTKTDYPDMVRLVIYEDFNTSTVYKFLTNDFTLPAITIAELYRERWNVELFFKWIKQHLHIKAFFGTSQNAVYAQIWIAICDYLLLIIAKRVYHI